ncbi:MAG: CRISPR-associated protein Cas4 [Conexivisphaera sp.]
MSSSSPPEPEELLELGLSGHEGWTPPPGVYYPSRLGYCLRRLYYERTLGPRASPPEARILGAAGRAVHGALEEALSAAPGMGIVVEVEVPATLRLGDIVLSGRADALLEYPEGRRVVVELKTTSMVPNEPFREHRLQLHFYMRALGAREGVLVYVSRTSGARRYFREEYDPSLADELVSRALLLHEYLRRSVPPPTEASEWECGICEYRDVCELEKKILGVGVSAHAASAGGATP